MRRLFLNRLVTLGVCSGLLYSGAALAQPTPTSTNLLDFWLVRQVDRQPMPTDWAYAYVERQADDTVFRQRRIDAELTGLAMALRLTSYSSLAEGVRDWQQTLNASSARRSPGRVDVAWLAAHPRHVPAMADLKAIGACDRPPWVEVWSTHGVTRLDWRNGMQSDALLDALPEPATGLAESAALVSPLGEIHRFGIAPWNYVTVPVAPGSRLWLDLPDDLVPGQATVTRWLNVAMPEALAMQLPGNDCMALWQRDAATTDTSE